MTPHLMGAFFCFWASWPVWVAFSASKSDLQFKKFHRKRRQGRPQLLKFLARTMHFKPHEFAGLQEVLQQLPHVFQMGQRTGGAPVTLTYAMAVSIVHVKYTCQSQSIHTREL